MPVRAFVALLLMAVLRSATPDGAQRKDWVLLVAGSAGWQNYRAQADICHIYHTIINRGNVPKRHVIVMMSDTLAQDKENPYPGEIFNAPPDPEGHYVDVYYGCNVDFAGTAVTPRMVLSVLNGTAPHGRSIGSTLQDNPFVVYIGHGFADGWVLPDDSLLFAKDLWAVIEQKAFKFASFYHVGQTSTYLQLPDSLNNRVYALTASRPNESSYAYYCPTGNTTKLNVCLANQFSVGWLHNLDAQQTMGDNYAASKSFCWNQGNMPSSHVTTYGAISIVHHIPISQFF